MLTDEQIAALEAPLAEANVKKREGKFSYIEGHHAIREANRIFGFGRWRRETLSNRPVREVTDYAGKEGKVGYYVAYVAQVRVHVRVGEEWVATDGTGYGESVTYLQAEGQAHESASKEAETDAMKRALICWGDQFGLALYDRDQTHVEGAAPRTGGGQRSAPASAPAGPVPVCPKCGKPMKVRTGKSGEFYGCTGYPDCKGTMNIPQAPAFAAAVVNNMFRDADQPPIAAREEPESPGYDAGGYPVTKTTLAAWMADVLLLDKTDLGPMRAKGAEVAWGGAPPDWNALTPAQVGELARAIEGVVTGAEGDPFGDQ